MSRRGKHHRKHYKDRDYHHLRPRSRSGKNITSNLLLIDIERHRLLHKIFGNRTLEEIIYTLQRLQSAKSRQAA